MKTIKKNQIFRVCLLFVALFITAQLSATECFTIYGRIKSEKNQSLKNATVTLYDVVTRQAIATAKCKANGSFSLNDIPQGEYLLMVLKDEVAFSQTKWVIVDELGNFVLRDLDAPKTNKTSLDPNLVAEK